ncbi:hypothetical protein F1188_14910 [Roseospira marina]|uniref:Glycosyl transferase n=1 Tax=Roseospira marina TaxID=140057 RepID=A0A5M6I8V4_9PROT|nr:hypothetical protein [Roseospira marina]KAA5604700.1 hypothetical protein F1188_14910 [Roseospira marina]MBB4315148.1 hypothetical protein [Roseospira marina]MBB5088082.1 hypothetical protein [Roseospira marina]
MPDIVFLFIGGSHQVFHVAPVAAELSRSLPDVSVVCLYPHGDQATADSLHRVREDLIAPALRIEGVRVPLPGRVYAAVIGRKSARKRFLLLSLIPRLRRAKAVVTAERTSARLRSMGLRSTLMIQFRHGAGDRAPRSERRLAAFDLVVVPGPKDLQRALAQGYVPAEKLRTCGYVKLDFFTDPARRIPRVFDNERPTVLYNPHFDPEISSWPVAAEVIDRFRHQSRYNLIFAPHIRVSENMGAAERDRWQSLAEPGKILIDLDSPRLVDMTYTLASDVYLGDMSSQLYEFLIRPRPAAFINAHHAAWRHNARFAGWALGEVAESVDAVLTAIDTAVAGHPAQIARQTAAVREAFGEVSGAAARGAEIVRAQIASTP